MPSLDQALRAALAARENLLAELHAQGTDCYRLFHGSQEGAPGLTVDRYGPQLLVQSFHQPLEANDLHSIVGSVEACLGQPLLLVYNDRSRAIRGSIATRHCSWPPMQHWRIWSAANGG